MNGNIIGKSKRLETDLMENLAIKERKPVTDHIHSEGSNAANCKQHIVNGSICLARFLNYRTKKSINVAFKCIYEAVKQNHFETKEEKLLKKTVNNGLYRRRQIKLSVLKQWVWMSYCQLSQRPFWRWKFQLKAKLVSKPQSFQRNLKSSIRNLSNRLYRLAFKSLQIGFYEIKASNTHKDFIKSIIAVHKNRSLKIRLACKTLECILAKSIKIWLIRYIKNVKKLNPGLLKKRFSFINSVLLSNLKRVWDAWVADLEYIYTEENEEVLATVKLEVHNYNAIKKPCVVYYYHDNSSFDPAFQAVFRNLGHFIRRKLRLFIRQWYGIMCKKPSICSNGSSITDVSLDNATLKVPSSLRNNLKDLVNHFYLVYLKRLEMPKISFARWAEVARIRSIKICRLKILVLKNQTRHELMKYAFEQVKLN